MLFENCLLPRKRNHVGSVLHKSHPQKTIGTTIYFTYDVQASEIRLQPTIEFIFNLKTTVDNHQQLLNETTTSQKDQIETCYSSSFRKLEHKLPANMAR